VANWYEPAVKTLLDMAQENPQLTKIIRATVLQIDENPKMGQPILGDRYIYTNRTYRFRISYRYMPGQIEIVEIGLF
jgi:hypothetical protein